MVTLEKTSPPAAYFTCINIQDTADIRGICTCYFLISRIKRIGIVFRARHQFENIFRIPEWQLDNIIAKAVWPILRAGSKCPPNAGKKAGLSAGLGRRAIFGIDVTESEVQTKTVSGVDLVSGKTNGWENICYAVLCRLQTTDLLRAVWLFRTLETSFRQAKLSTRWANCVWSKMPT